MESFQTWFLGCHLLVGIVFGLSSASSVSAEGTIPLLQHWEGQYSSAQTKEYVIIRNPEAWRKAWAKAHANAKPVPELPTVNFNKSIILAAFLGKRDTGGYTVQITRVLKTEQGVKVYVKNKIPNPRDPKAQVITSPYYFGVVPATEEKVTFVEE